MFSGQKWMILGLGPIFADVAKVPHLRNAWSQTTPIFLQGIYFTFLTHNVRTNMIKNIKLLPGIIVFTWKPTFSFL